MQTLGPQKGREEYKSAFERGSLGGSVSLHLRLWTYGGPAQPLCGLPLEQDPEIAELTRSIIREGKAVSAVQRTELLSAGFDSALDALATAKTLQQRFLTFHRKTEPQQIVPSILIYRTRTEPASSPDDAAPEDMLANVTSAQILVGESIFEQVKSVPGVRFNPKPVREAGETFGPEAIYELLWTDESTYGHLRQAGSMGLNNMGRYLIQEELGRGAMGAVHKAYDQIIGRTVALKTIAINRDTPDRDELVERLMQEAKAAGKLDHPNIITIYDVGQQDDRVYLSMQFVEGETLLKILTDSGVPPLPTLFSWADQISAAVGYAHAHGVVHRDLKPANLMLTRQGVIKVLDFGIAKVENSSLTQTGLVVGTPSYMAPEQVSGKKIDHRADIFALGSVFYELVTHEKAFRGDVTTILYKIIYEDPVAPSLINPSIPGGIDAIIRKALAKDPDQRFQSCEELRSAFLEQAARLNISLPASLPSAAPTIKPVSGAPSPIQQDPEPIVVSEPSKRSGPGTAIAVLVALIAVAGWVRYAKSHKNLLTPQVKPYVTTFEPAPGSQPSRNAAAEKPSAQISAVTSDQAPGKIPDAVPDSGTPGTTATTMPPAASSSQTVPVQTSHPAASIPQQAQPADSSAKQAVDAQVPITIQQNEQPAREDAGTPGPSTNEDSSADQTITSTDDSQIGSLAPKPQKKLRLAAAPIVDGFTRRDVPELLRQADAATGRGDYRLARYEYNLILKLDATNATARAGLRRVQSAESPQ